MINAVTAILFGVIRVKVHCRAYSESLSEREIQTKSLIYLTYCEWESIFVMVQLSRCENHGELARVQIVTEAVTNLILP